MTVLVQEESAQPLCEEHVLLPNPVHMMGSPIALIQTTRAIHKILKQAKPDVIHFLVEPYVLAMPIVRWLIKTPPWVLIMLGTYTVTPFLSWKTRWLADRAWQQTAAFAFCSNFTRTRALSATATNAPKAKIQMEQKGYMFRLGLPHTTYTPKAITSAPATILFVGGIKARKGVLEIVRACKAFRDISPLPFHLHLVGSYDPYNAYSQQIAAFIKEQKMENMVTFEGKISTAALEQLYAKTDVFIMLSKDDFTHFEGFGMVFLEASAHGIPTIGSLHSGCEEAIQDGVSGYTVEADNPQMIATRMQWILMEHKIDPIQCQAWAKEHSIEQQVDSFEASYNDILSHH